MTIILPGSPLFDETLALAPPPDWVNYAADRGNGDAVAFVADAFTGILRSANWNEVEEYAFGGEWDARMEALGWTEEELERL